MASQRQEMSHKIGEGVGQAQQYYTNDSRIHGHGKSEEKKEGMMSQMGNKASETAHQTSNILQQTGESVKNMAAGATDAVKNTLGINNPSNSPTNSTPGGNTLAGSNTTAIPPSATAHPTI